MLQSYIGTTYIVVRSFYWKKLHCIFLYNINTIKYQCTSNSLFNFHSMQQFLTWQIDCGRHVTDFITVSFPFNLIKVSTCYKLFGMPGLQSVQHIKNLSTVVRHSVPVLLNLDWVGTIALSLYCGTVSNL